MEGFLDKQGGGTSMFGSTAYKLRYFKLTNGTLTYHLDPTSESKGSIPIPGSVFRDSNEDYEFEIYNKRSDIRTFHLKADTAFLKEMWKKGLASVGTEMGES